MLLSLPLTSDNLFAVSMIPEAESNEKKEHFNQLRYLMNFNGFYWKWTNKSVWFAIYEKNIQSFMIFRGDEMTLNQPFFRNLTLFFWLSNNDFFSRSRDLLEFESSVKISFLRKNIFS